MMKKIVLKDQAVAEQPDIIASFTGLFFIALFVEYSLECSGFHFSYMYKHPKSDLTHASSNAMTNPWYCPKLLLNRKVEHNTSFLSTIRNRALVTNSEKQQITPMMPSNSRSWKKAFLTSKYLMT